VKIYDVYTDGQYDDHIDTDTAVEALGQACDNMDTHFFSTVLREVDAAREERRKVKERWSVHIRVQARDDAEEAAGDNAVVVLRQRQIQRAGVKRSGRRLCHPRMTGEPRRFPPGQPPSGGGTHAYDVTDNGRSPDRSASASLETCSNSLPGE
jgi:hypothetical protein